MKQKNLSLLFLFFLLLIPSISFSQRAVVGLSKLKVLYIGVDNPVEIAISGIPEDRIVVSIEGGTITGEKGAYFVKPIDSPGIRQATISVGYQKRKNKITRVGTFSFRIKAIPPPKIFLGSKEGGLISTSELRLQTILSAQLENFIYEGLRHKIMSYNFNILSERNIFSTTDTTGKLSDKIIQHLYNTRAGDIIIIDEVKVLGPNGVQNLSPIKFTIFDERTPKTVEAKEKHIKAFSCNSVSSYSDGCNYYTINREYRNNKKEGNWKYYILKDSINYILKKDSFINDMLVESKQFFSNSKIYKYISFKKPDYDTGYYKSFYLSGKVESTGKIVQKAAIIYYPEIEEIRKQYVKGMDILEEMNVRQEDYLPSDFDITIIKTGEWKFYYENGNLKRKGSYFVINDEKTEEASYYFKKYKTTEVSRQGKWSFYKENGKLEKEIIYDKGKVISEKKY